jgi:hypothetical protein
MPKKKKDQTEGPAEAQVNNVFPEVGAAQGAAASSQTASLPPDVAELVRSTLRVVIAQRRTYGLAATLTSIVNSVNKALERYLKRVPKYALRGFIRDELTAMGYPVFEAVVEYGYASFRADVVMLYRDYQEVVDMVKAGRTSSLIRSVIVADGIDPAYDRQIGDV